MVLKLYNTLNRKKEEFKPVEEGKVSMYVCGPTVYNYITVGNARPVIVFNMVRNYLEHQGYKMKYVQNITDIEDKIINKANEEKVDTQIITERYIKAFLEDIQNLDVGSFDEMPRATEMIKEIINIIGRIIKNGYGYVIGKNVYFDVSKFSGYGKLSGQKIDEMKDSEESHFGKKDKIDFALWKEAKEREPSWDSPWGKGRPGWHIECSAMSTKLLGKKIDIHGGGIDLIFPHHENEIAQSIAAFPEKGGFVNYWMHNGMIEVKSSKMSKSAGLKDNWILKNLLKVYSPNVIKIYMLSTHYRSPLEFSVKKLEEAKKSLERITNTFENIRFLIKKSENLDKVQSLAAEDKELAIRFIKLSEDFEKGFTKSMDDDFNSARAIAYIFDLIKELNTILGSPGFYMGPEVAKSLNTAHHKINILGLILGLDFEKELLKSSKDLFDETAISKEEILKLIKQRESDRKNRDFASADRIRDHLLEKGIILEDRKEGTSWKQTD